MAAQRCCLLAYVSPKKLIGHNFYATRTSDWTPAQRVNNFDAITGEAVELRRRNISGNKTHWLVSLYTDGIEFFKEQQYYDFCARVLADAIGSGEEAKKRIYLLSCERPFGFGAEIDEKTSCALQACNQVLSISEDYYYGARNKDPSVRSAARFVPKNLNHRLDNIFSYHHLSERNLEWNSDHWLINVKLQDGEFPSNKEIFDHYVRLLAKVVGSEEEAKKKIYIMWFELPFGFGAKIDAESSNKLKGLPDVRLVFPDNAFVFVKDKYSGNAPLVVYPTSPGSRSSYYRLTENYDNEDWVINIEEEVGESGNLTYYPLKFDSGQMFDHRHWFITMKRPGMETSSVQKRMGFYFRTLAIVVGSEEAKKKIYRIRCESNFFGFGAEIDEAASKKLKGLPGVLAVLPDYLFYNCPKVRSLAQFSPINWNHQLNDIYSYHHLSKLNSKWNSDHWIVHIKQPDGEHNGQQIVHFCTRMLAEVIGSEEDAKKKIYSVWCKKPFGFGAEVDQDTSNKLKALDDVLVVLPDYAFDVKNKDRGALVITPLSRLKAISDSVHFRYSVCDNE